MQILLRRAVCFVLENYKQTKRQLHHAQFIFIAHLATELCTLFPDSRRWISSLPWKVARWPRLWRFTHNHDTDVSSTRNCRNTASRGGANEPCRWRAFHRRVIIHGSLFSVRLSRRDKCCHGGLNGFVKLAGRKHCLWTRLKPRKRACEWLEQRR